MYMIMFVLDDVGLLDQVLNAWLEKGISGATIVETSGLNRQLNKHVPMRYSFGSSAVEETGHITLFVIVGNEQLIHICLEATEVIVGDLDQPNTGVFSAWPLTLTKGIPTTN